MPRISSSGNEHHNLRLIRLSSVLSSRTLSITTHQYSLTFIQIRSSLRISTRTSNAFASHQLREMASKNRTASDTHDDLAPQPCKKKTRVHSPDKTSNVNTGISNDTRSPAKADEITLPRQMKDHPKQGYKRDDSNIPENRV